MTATKKHYAFRGRLMSLLVLTHCGVSSRPLGLRLLVPPKTSAPTGVYVFFLRWWSSYLVPVITITDTMLVWSGGPLTPARTKVFDGASNRSPSTCLKTPQYFKEGRLRPFFANNVDIPF